MIEEYGNIVNSTFENNHGRIGGAVYSDSEGDFINSTFTNNIASNGGAIYNTGSAKVIMSIFSDNTGYSSVAKLATKIDIYNNDGSLEDVVIF